MGDIIDRLGEVGLPAPMSELTATDWDVIIIGGGHNGLTCAAYLARAGKRVLVLERRDRLGGACTLERPFADPSYIVSPCAYVVGLLDQVVIDELGLARAEPLSNRCSDRSHPRPSRARPHSRQRYRRPAGKCQNQMSQIPPVPFPSGWGSHRRPNRRHRGKFPLP
jgi:choline dehydrogenase-like flavoprotein